jgi:hypothetical protein
MISNKQLVSDYFLNKEAVITIYPATVKSVSGNTCTVDILSSDLEIEDVRLVADIDDKDTFLITPSVGSTVLVGCIENQLSNAFICQFSSIKSGMITIGTTGIAFDKDSIDLKKGNSIIQVNADSVDIKRVNSEVKIDGEGIGIKTPNSSVKVSNSGVSLQYGLMLPDGRIKIELSSNGSIMVDDKTLFAFDKDEFKMGKENSAISFGDDQVLLEQGGMSIELANQKVNIKNDVVSLKELFNDLANLIQNLKVITPTGPSTALFPDTLVSLAAFKAKYPLLLS